MKKLLVLCCLFSMCVGYAEAGISKIKAVKVVVTSSIASAAYIQDKEIKDEVLKDLKASLSKIKIKDGADVICEIRYSDDYKLSVINDMYGSYYMAMVIKSEHKNYDKMGASHKVYWERGFFMPMIACSSLNASVKNNIGAFVSAFADDWMKDQKANKE